MRIGRGREYEGNISIEFVTRQTIFTEFAGAKQGDFVLIGESADADPISTGALEVRAIAGDADIFHRVADAFRIMT